MGLGLVIFLFIFFALGKGTAQDPGLWVRLAIASTIGVLVELNGIKNAIRGIKNDSIK